MNQEKRNVKANSLLGAALAKLQSIHVQLKATATLALVFLASSFVPTAQASDLFSNTNPDGVLSNPPVSYTLFTLSQAAQITQLVTYHWANGAGTPNSVGNIGIWSISNGSPGKLLRAVAAHGVAATNNVIADWVADLNCASPGCYLPAGTYAIEDSESATWSYNSASGLRGFAIVRGNFVSSIPTGAILITGQPVSTVPAPQPVAYSAMDLFNNTDTQPAYDGYLAQVGTSFTLTRNANVSQIITTHFSASTISAPPSGTPVIKLMTGSSIPEAQGAALVIPGQSVVIAGKSGSIESWVLNINPPVALKAGTYIVDDNGHATWAHNAHSTGCLSFQPSWQCGFTIVSGAYTSASTGGSGSSGSSGSGSSGGGSGTPVVQFPCVHNPAAFTNIVGPSCVFTTTEMMKLLIDRPLSGSITSVAFNWLPNQSQSVNPVTPPASSPTQNVLVPAGGPTAVGRTYTLTPPVAMTLCPLRGQGSLWQVTPFVGGLSLGASGVIMVDCR